MTEQLWAPWRLEYIAQAGEADGCFLCAAAVGDDDEELLVVHRGAHAFVLLNRYPYVSGHLMVAPLRHVGELEALEQDEVVDIHALTAAALRALREVYAPH